MAIVVTLAVVGGFMALDKTVLHVYSPEDSQSGLVAPAPTPIPTQTGPSRTAEEVDIAVEEQEVLFCELAEFDLDFVARGLTRWDGARSVWILPCLFRVTPEDDYVTGCLLVDDRTLEVTDASDDFVCGPAFP
ncbi:MAG: hypothetical protein IIC90_09565 [Chloroflexi bacterium]|nr:hypothetical protein [Chloroflexota bacterium]